MAGLAPANLRQLPLDNDNAGLGDIVVQIAEDGPDQSEVDKSGNVIRIKHGDGSVTVSRDGRPIDTAQRDANKGWFANLIDDIEQNELGRISEELLRGVDNDLNSRKEWVETRAQGLRLLGLQIEVPGLEGASDGAPVEGMSNVRHPLLLEAVLRFQANARAEMLPTDGPVKIRNDSNDPNLAQDQLANDLEKDFNHYLTATATEYYPDTDRMFLKFGFGGTGFKKVYFCPLRNRPVSETVDADDLIVNNAATDLANAKRVTHRVMLRPSTVKRLQILGVYKDIDLSTPMPAKLDSQKREEKSQQGVQPESMDPLDRDREIYECYCELDVKGFEHKYNGKVSGLEIPYRVTIDVSSRQILSLVRNYNQDSEKLPEARVTFVQYVFVPGFGFYPIGLLHILGNTTNAVTAAWREALDNGMFANFPGFLVAKGGTRQNTSIIRVPPGGGQQIDTNGMKMGDAVMPLPYTSQHMPALLGLVENMVETGQRVGGTAELQVGEGKQDAPVGTTLALIEQATKVVNSVHKRMHTAQAQEFMLLADCFREHPEAFWQRKGKSGRAWDEATFLQALTDYDLVPQADPNTASYTQRVMKVQALNMWAANNPGANREAVDRATLLAMGWSADQFMLPPDQRQLPPEVQKGIAELQNEKTRSDAAMMTAQAGAQKVKQEGLAAAEDAQAKIGQQQDTPVDVLEAHTRAREVGLKAHETQVRAASEAAGRQSDERIAAMDVAREVISKAMDLRQAEAEIPKVEREVGGG